MSTRTKVAHRAERGALPAEPLQERAYAAIKHRLITLDYRPGEYLNEASICLQLGFGRMPVHQALKRLMHEGMLEIRPRKGVIVNALSVEEVEELLEVRTPNEGLCAALAAKRADAADVAALRRVLAQSRTRSVRGNRERLMELDSEFHRTITRAARNRILADLLARLHDRSLRFWFITLGSPAQIVRVLDEHAAVCDAIAAHDPAAATRAIEAHIESFGRAMRRALLPNAMRVVP